MAKALMIDYEKCTGCRLCEQVCSVKHEGVSNPARSRIKVVKWEEEGLYIPMACQQCESAPCIATCPMNACSRDENMGRIVNDYDRCIGCKTCIVVCPFGAVGFDPISKKIISCDLCDGDPVCIKFCATKALQYVEDSNINKKQQRTAAEKLHEAKRSFVAETAT
ncbi:4Fe-4S dicluster domain-containing protein [Chloroflexota bacterium]